MIKPELYHKTVGILFDAYFNDTLEHENCAACAVGNIVAANMGCGFKKDINNELMWARRKSPSLSYGWPNVFVTMYGQQSISHENYSGWARRQIDSTGYTVDELSQVEFAFETAPHGRSKEDYMFNGLCAVLEVLAQIHQVTDEDLLTANNKRFKDHYSRKLQTHSI